MDPDHNLKEQRQLASKLLYEMENDRPVDMDEVLRLSELVIALDMWIREGGALPRDWKS